MHSLLQLTKVLFLFPIKVFKREHQASDKHVGIHNVGMYYVHEVFELSKKKIHTINISSKKNCSQFTVEKYRKKNRKCSDNNKLL